MTYAEQLAANAEIARLESERAKIQAECPHANLKHDYRDYGFAARDTIWCQDCGEILSNVEWAGGGIGPQDVNEVRARSLKMRELRKTCKHGDGLTQLRCTICGQFRDGKL